MTISRELLDELLSGVERPEDLLGDKGLMKELNLGRPGPGGRRRRARPGAVALGGSADGTNAGR